MELLIALFCLELSTRIQEERVSMAIEKLHKLN